MIVVHKVDEVYLCVDAPTPIMHALHNHFSFSVPGAKFMPAYKSGGWDGRVRLFNIRSGYLYLGLLPRLRAFLKDRNLQAEYVGLDEDEEPVSQKRVNKLIATLPMQPRDYQYDAFMTAITKRRGVFLSSTGSGKSLIIYLIARWLHEVYQLPTLLIVPTVGLVKQMAGDFDSYGGKGLYQVVHAGKTKVVTEEIVISTWQSLTKMPKEWLRAFGCVIVDEVHGAKAKALTSILERMNRAQFRFGLTGTLDGMASHQAIIEGLLGPVKQVSRTADLIAAKVLAKLKVNILKLTYPETTCRTVLDGTYQDEVKTICGLRRRNTLIVSLAKRAKGNTLILFNYIEVHGDILYERLRQESGKEVYYLHGKVDADVREDVRQIVEKADDAIILASSGVFSTGINLKRLHNIIFASPSKSRVRVLQSIGRGLRTAPDKLVCHLFDLVDDFRHGSDTNYTYRHYEARRKMYESEGFPYVERNIDLAEAREGPD